MKPSVNIRGANKEAKIYVGMSTTVHIFCFALMHYAWITSQDFYWLVVWTNLITYCSLSVFVHGQPPKIKNKNIKQKNFAEFHNHFPLLTILKPQHIPQHCVSMSLVSEEQCRINNSCRCCWRFSSVVYLADVTIDTITVTYFLRETVLSQGCNWTPMRSSEKKSWWW